MKAIGEYLQSESGPPTFEQWWSEYPPGRKQGKKKAEQIFEKLDDKKKSAAFLGLVRHRDTNPQWRDPKYVPMPTTFLNQERWNDEIVLTRSEASQERANTTKDNCDFVWTAMIEMYGERWVKTHGDKPAELWVKFLRPIPESRVRRGLRHTLTRCKEHPPSLPQFIEFCAPTFGEQHPDPQLPRPESSSETMESGFAQLREILGYQKPIKD